MGTPYYARLIKNILYMKKPNIDVDCDKKKTKKKWLLGEHPLESV